MPFYCYRKVGSGELIELEMSMDEVSALPVEDDVTTLPDGTEAMRDVQAEHLAQDAGGEAWPMLSEAMGVHPSQIPEMRRQAKHRGVPTDFTPDGRVILRNRAHRKKFGEAFRFFDKDGGYGDPQRR